MRVSDPTRLEVVKNSLEGIAEGMALTLVRTSRSSVVRPVSYTHLRAHET